MAFPVEYHESNPIDARLVTKSSLSHPKKAIAMLIIFWLENDRPSLVEYGLSESTNQEKGILDEECVRLLRDFIQLHNIDLNEDAIQKLLIGNPLFLTQIEALNVAFELIWRLASIDFVDKDLSRSSERKGRKRFRKKISYTINLDIIDAAFESDSDGFAEVLIAWLFDEEFKCNATLEKRFVRILAAFAETSFYKTSKGADGITFNTDGIYEALLSGNEFVEIVPQGEELQGSTRILKSALADGLNPMLKINNEKEVSKSLDVTDVEFSNYAKRAKVTNLLSCVSIKQSSLSIAKKDDTSLNTKLPRNLIFFGAPGTGKSYELSKRANEFFGENTCRVTFYPDYTYSQFVGCYKPYVYSGNVDYEKGNSNDSTITYEFVPGPFLDLYIKACINPSLNYLFIIEEINRANAAAVFGDLFQLLDRDDEGVSAYKIVTPKEIHDYLAHAQVLAKNSSYPLIEENISGDTEISLPFQNIDPKNLSLPKNFYIWATMNSADQGVFPMDTAFKRRWDFEYIGINNAEDEIKSKRVSISNNEGKKFKVFWNELRHAINNLLVKNNISEDKLLGPFFITPSFLDDEEKFTKAFKDKVLLYLFEDAAKTKRPYIFNCEPLTYSNICREFECRGAFIFKDDDISNIYSECKTVEKDEETL